MDRDLLLLIGLAFVPMAVVALVAAWADRRRPIAFAILLAMAMGMVGYAHFTHPDGGYDWREVPMLAVETLGRLTR